MSTIFAFPKEARTDSTVGAIIAEGMPPAVTINPCPFKFSARKLPLSSNLRNCESPSALATARLFPNAGLASLDDPVCSTSVFA